MQREDPRSGPLRNGNPRGNPNLAPRCGAKTRAGCACRSPAMPNGRCRMHGGTSTGPRTPAGLAKARAAPAKHGGYNAEHREFFRRMNAFMAETRAILAACRANTLCFHPGMLRRLSPAPLDVSAEASAPCPTQATGLDPKVAHFVRHDGVPTPSNSSKIVPSKPR